MNITKTMFSFLLFLLFFSHTSYTQDYRTFSSVISPQPLTIPYEETSSLENTISMCKKLSFPAALSLLIFLQNNKIISDMQRHPYTASIALYFGLSFLLESINNEHKNWKNSKLKKIFHKICLILIISYEIKNPLIQKFSSTKSQSASSVLNNSYLEQQENLFAQACKLWQSTFEYFQITNPKAPLFHYDLNNINQIHVNQIASYDPTLQALVTKFYESDSMTDYKNLNKFLYDELEFCKQEITNLKSYK